MKRLSYELPSKIERGYSVHGRIEMTVLNMAAENIRSMISDEMMREIKYTDPNPEFKAFVVGHEGTAFPTEVGAGSIVMKWFRSAIEKLVDVLKVGTKVFHNHNEDSSHGGRISIGQVVGKALRKVKDKISAVAVMYIYPQFRNLPLNIASVEADVKVDPQSSDTFKAIGVDEITGIALGSSADDAPAFSGAKLIGELQAFQGRSLQIKGGDVDKITIDEIRTVIKEEKIQPNDIFGRDALTDDPVVKGFIDAEKKQATSGEYAHRKREEEVFDKKKEEYEEQMKEKDEKISELQKKAAKGDIKKMFKDAAEKREFGDKQKDFIEANLEKFEVKEPDKIESELSDFFDNQVDEFKKVAKVFGIEEETNGDDKKNEDGEKGEKKEKKEKGSGGTKEGGTIEGNPFLPSIDELDD